MRLLILMRGAPGCGKSTFIKEHHLENYTLSADDFRLKYSAPVLDVNGNFTTDQTTNKAAWTALYTALEARMQRGDLTVIDACNSKATELNKYKDYIKMYRYRCWVVDFTDVPLDEVKRRNKTREPLKQVSDEIVENYYSRQFGQSIPSGFKVIKREDFDKEFTYSIRDLSNYENVYVIGDIHGCYTALKEMIPEIKENNFYIFCGDYLDRGIENDEVFKQISEWMKLPNVLTLEGNHEKHLFNYVNDLKVKSSEFLNNTLPQLSVTKSQISEFYKKMAQCAYFEYNGQKYFVSHAGVSYLPENILLLSTQQFTKGVGRYEDTEAVGKAFEKNNPDIIQIHGHRKSIVNPDDFYTSKNSITLENSVEFGGCLRAVKISKNGLEILAVRNTVFREKEEPKPKEKLSLSETLEKMRDSKFIIEKELDDGVSSFNFNRDAFFKKEWNETTIKARGLFIQNNKVAARGYEKFFNIGEVKETELANLKNNLELPISIYKKYNGFLGLLGYNEKTDSLLFCSKSSTNSEFSNYFRNIFYTKYASREKEVLKYIKENNKCLVFEVIDPINDPHIIKYNESDIILLDILERELEYKPLDYLDLFKVGSDLGFTVKECVKVFDDYESFYNFITEAKEPDYQLNNQYTEGFVICGKNNFMTKLKTEYYNFWKHMRSVSAQVFKLNKLGEYQGYIARTSGLITAEANNFYNYICKLAKEKYTGKTDIVTLREKYLANKSL